MSIRSEPIGQPGFDRVVVITRDREFWSRLTGAGRLGLAGDWRRLESAGQADAATAELDDTALLVLDTAAIDGRRDAATLAPLPGLRRAWPDVRVLAAVDEAKKANILKLLDRGAHGVVSKSASARQLCDAIRTLASGRIHVPAEVAELDPSPESPPPGGRPDGPEADDVAQGLTPRQRQVLERLVRGKSNKEIARDLDLREGTIKVHLAAVLRKLKVSNRTAAAAVGARLLMVPT